MNFNSFSIDEAYIVEKRRQLHQYPEIGFDLPRTVALVKEELAGMGISYTEKYGKGSVVADINPEKTGFTIALRADMDALALQEKTGLPYSSRVDGAMHACGHDAHTAMLLGAAQALGRLREQIGCRVRLLFQPSEEGFQSGAQMMTDNGVMDGVDLILGLHVENSLPAGRIGVCSGMSMSSSRNYRIEFFGRTAHAALPHTGQDALAMAVKAYTAIQLMLAREIDPFEKYICSIGALHAGTTQNVVADHAVMLSTVRTYNLELDRYIKSRIEAIVEHTAGEIGAGSSVTADLKSRPLYNDPRLSALLLDSARKVVGDEGIAEMPMKMSSEDFSLYLTQKPGVFFRLGTRPAGQAHVGMPHNNDFIIAEEALPYGSAAFVQFVLDYMGGIPPEN